MIILHFYLVIVCLCCFEDYLRGVLFCVIIVGGAVVITSLLYVQQDFTFDELLEEVAQTIFIFSAVRVSNKKTTKQTCCTNNK